MTTEELEQRTREVTAAPNARRIVDALPVSPNRDAQSVKDLIVQDLPEKENSLVQFVLKALMWTVYIVALGVVALLLQAVGNGYLSR